MTAIGGRPLTVIHPQMVATAVAAQAMIVARRSWCGRYVTYQAYAGDAPPAGAVLAADAEDVAMYAATFGAQAGARLQETIEALGIANRV